MYSWRMPHISRSMTITATEMKPITPMVMPTINPTGTGARLKFDISMYDDNTIITHCTQCRYHNIMIPLL